MFEHTHTQTISPEHPNEVQSPSSTSLPQRKRSQWYMKYILLFAKRKKKKLLFYVIDLIVY